MNKQKTDTKVEIKGLQDEVQQKEAETEEQKTQYLNELATREKELCDAEAEIVTISMHPKFRTDFKKY